MAGTAILLVGHGGVPRDAPRELVQELKRLEGERRARRVPTPSAREREVERTIREWPRTPATDPYKYGIEALAAALRPRLGGRPLAVAYNEFCAPSVGDAIDALVAAGATDVTLVSTMFTPGGSHAELELPEAVEAARARHPRAVIRYAWPFDLGLVADFLAAHVAEHAA